MRIYDIMFDYISRLAFNAVYFAVKKDEKDQTRNQKKILNSLLNKIQNTKF
jgi:hypothetical protein